ncbi:MAG: hypothetical protein CVT98_01055, partial [Bacteroidetes bacterium HGW-Bacteroidetes-15]
MHDPQLYGLPVSIEKPKPHFFSSPPRPFLASTPNREAFEMIKRGSNFCFEGTYGTAMAFYSWVKKQVNLLYPISDYKTSRINRDKLREFSQRLFVRIKNQNIDLVNAPKIPWLQEFYSDFDDYYLPFTEVLGMNGAWQWWVNGIQVPGLMHKVHPFYGVYFPTRFEHLQLFDQWLSQNKSISSAMDLGTGCGVLTFYMMKHGVKNILATDINPNSLYSVSKELERLKGEKFVRLKHASFFEGLDTKELDLVVFNPPWIPEKPSNSLDLAMYYQPDYFQLFFQQAYSALPIGCRLVMLYSTYAQVAGIEKMHPIEYEVNSNKRFKLVQKVDKPLSQVSISKKNWLTHIRQFERVEL